MERIVVGVDGSESAGAALRWAAEEAKRHGASLAAVLAWSYLDQRHADGDQRFEPSYTEEDARRALQAAVDAVAPAVAPEQRAVCDLPASALVDAAADADLLVVGARGLGGFAGLLLGSISEGVLESAPCPVAVVRGDGSTPAGGPVVVGIDGSEGAARAMHWAAAEARARSVRLQVVHAWHVPALAGMVSGPMMTAIEEGAREVLDEALRDPALEGVDVEGHVVCDGAAQAVLAFAAEAGLVVAGSRGMGRLGRALLGSTSRQLTHHSPCPIVVVPDG